MFTPNPIRPMLQFKLSYALLGIWAQNGYNIYKKKQGLLYEAINGNLFKIFSGKMNPVPMLMKMTPIQVPLKTEPALAKLLGITENQCQALF
ncbi:hypothetical protein B4Q04_08900 [Zobellia sp. OII3]|nr:hypothetical protein B4Q04_08900 [Zobellia sp. OII3]